MCKRNVVYIFTTQPTFYIHRVDLPLLRCLYGWILLGLLKFSHVQNTVFLTNLAVGKTHIVKDMGGLGFAHYPLIKDQ